MNNRVRRLPSKTCALGAVVFAGLAFAGAGGAGLSSAAAASSSVKGAAAWYDYFSDGELAGWHGNEPDPDGVPLSGSYGVQSDVGRYVGQQIWSADDGGVLFQGVRVQSNFQASCPGGLGELDAQSQVVCGNGGPLGRIQAGNIEIDGPAPFAIGNCISSGATSVKGAIVMWKPKNSSTVSCVYTPAASLPSEYAFADFYYRITRLSNGKWQAYYAKHKSTSNNAPASWVCMTGACNGGSAGISTNFSSGYAVLVIDAGLDGADVPTPCRALAAFGSGGGSGSGQLVAQQPARQTSVSGSWLNTDNANPYRTGLFADHVVWHLSQIEAAVPTWQGWHSSWWSGSAYLFTGGAQLIRGEYPTTYNCADEPPPPPPPPNVPGTGLLDDFNNRGDETPVSQGGNWAPTGANGGTGVPLSQNRLQNFAQPSYSYRVTPYVGGESEAWATVSSRPNNGDWVSLLLCLQGAGTSTWDGYELRATAAGGPDLWQIRRITDGQSTSIGAVNMEIAAGGTMLVRRTLVELQFWWKPPGGTWTQKLSVGNADFQWGMIGVGGYKTGALDDFGGGSLLSLLEQYVPELRFDTLEGYRADSAAMMTDSYVSGDHSNELRDGQDGVLAASDPAIQTPASPVPLSLTYLATYANPDGTHRLREAPSYKADADRLRALPQYGNKVYGRVFTYNGVIALQYWLFYYYNPKTFYFVGNHEGDWESITVLLNSNGTQIGAAYSQHTYGETCSWQRVETTPEGRPRVYVGEGSHASYFTASPPLGHPVYYPDIQAPPVATDNVDGLGVPGPLIPSVTDITQVPAWMNWPGVWGASGGSPVGPPAQGFKWDNPVLWAFSPELLQCRTSALLSRQQATQTHRLRNDQTLGATHSGANLGLPPAPAVRARLVGGKAVIDYRFKSFPTDRTRRPWMLVTSVASANPRYTPYTVRTRVTDRSGRVIQRRGAGPGPYKLRVATLSAVGTRSRIVEIPLKTVASG